MRKFTRSLAIFSFVWTGYACAAPPAPSSGVGAAPGAPRLHCEFQLSSWCIVEGAYIVNRILASDEIHDRLWTLKDRFSPSSQVLILEPNGCKSGFSDDFQLRSFKHNVKRNRLLWDQTIVSLKKDGTCNLTVLTPVASGDPMEWAFSSGIRLIQS